MLPKTLQREIMAAAGADNVQGESSSQPIQPADARQPANAQSYTDELAQENDGTQAQQRVEAIASLEVSAAADAEQLKVLKVLDVKEAAQKFWSDLHPGRLTYVQNLAEKAPLSKLAVPGSGSNLPSNVQHSLLQYKLCSGANRLSSCILPTLTADGLALSNHAVPSISSSSQQQQQTPKTLRANSGSSNSVWQFGFSLLKATDVGPTGLRSQRVSVRHVARTCIFDRKHNRFLGNVHTVPVSDVRSGGSIWVWDPARPAKTLAGVDTPRPDPIPLGKLSGSPAAAAARAAYGVGLFGDLSSTDAAILAGGAIAGAGGLNACIVRCAHEQPDPVAGLRKLDGERLSLYVELNVAYKLTVQDIPVLPQAESKGAGLVDELTTCWALVSLKRCADLTREMDISVPLYMGSLYQPALLSGLWEASRKLHPFRSMFTSAPQPQLTFTAGPLPGRPIPLLPYSLMPATCIARRDVAYLLAAARLATHQQLLAAAAAFPVQVAGTGFKMSGTHAAGPVSTQAGAALNNTSSVIVGVLPGLAAGFGDAALAALPKVLDDSVLLQELLAKWWGRCRGLLGEGKGSCLLPNLGCATIASLPTQAQLMTALKASLLEVSPLLHCRTLLPQHISNFMEHQAHREKMAAELCRVLDLKTGRQIGGRHPVEVLSSRALEFLYKPFDVAETRVCLADRLAADRWCRC